MRFLATRCPWNEGFSVYLIFALVAFGVSGNALHIDSKPRLAISLRGQDSEMLLNRLNVFQGTIHNCCDNNFTIARTGNNGKLIQPNAVATANHSIHDDLLATDRQRINDSGRPAYVRYDHIEQEISLWVYRAIGKPKKDFGIFGPVRDSVRLERQDQSYSDSDQADSIETRCDQRKRVGSPSLMRCFLSSYGGAPLGAQIGGVMAIGMITGCGIITGIGREFIGWASGFGWRWRLGRARRYSGLLSSACAIALLAWWISAA